MVHPFPSRPLSRGDQGVSRPRRSGRSQPFETGGKSAINSGTHLVSSDTLVDVAYHKIRKDIIEEYLPAGQKINLSDLCARYGVSPTPIKQALNRLMAEGLVENIPRKGCRVRPFNWSELDEIFELRLMMEVSFAPQATVAVQNTPKLQNRFEDNLQKNMELVQHYDTAEEYFETYEIDQQFHELIILASGNRTALRVYKNLNSHAYATYLFGKQPRIQTINGILEHRAIYESMKAGNVDQVCHLLNSHLENARKKISLSLKLQQNGGQL